MHALGSKQEMATQQHTKDWVLPVTQNAAIACRALNGVHVLKAVSYQVGGQTLQAHEPSEFSLESRIHELYQIPTGSFF